MAKFADIQQYTVANYNVHIPWDYIEAWITQHENMDLDLNPDFQRAHVWSKEKQIKYVEFILRNGKSGREIYWNCPGWMGSWKGGLVLVDGKQRLQAVRRFINNEIPAFGHLFKEYEDKLRMASINFAFFVNNLKTRKDVLQWYLDLNDGGVVHTDEELAKVRQLLAKEERHGTQFQPLREED